MTISLSKGYAPGAEGLLQPLKPYLEDSEVSEILMNAPEEIWIERRGAFFCFPVPEFTEAHVYRLFALIANENQQKLSSQYPLLSGNLSEGSRVQLCLPPVSPFPVMSIRRKVVRHFSLQDYENQNFYEKAYPDAGEGGVQTEHQAPIERALRESFHQKQWPIFMKLAVQARKNIVISGGTSSGKTTFLNACLREIDLTDRLLILEDTREIEAPHRNQVRLLASKGEQGPSRLTMQDLVQCSLRLRPDRIIMGEIRGKEIMDFLSACSTGHEGSMTTIHAGSPQIAFMRMTQMYKLNNVPSMSDADILRELHSAIDIVIQINKTPEGRKIQGVYLKKL